MCFFVLCDLTSLTVLCFLNSFARWHQVAPRCHNRIPSATVSHYTSHSKETPQEVPRGGERVSQRASRTRYSGDTESRVRIAFVRVFTGVVCVVVGHAKCLHPVRILGLHLSYSMYSTSHNNLGPKQHLTRMRYVVNKLN